MANVDTEFDFNESFWRYELSLSRTADINIQSPNDRLLEVQSDTSPAGPAQIPPVIEDPVARLQSFLASNSRRNSFSNPAPTAGANDANSDVQFRDLEALFNLEPSTDNPAFPLPWLFGDTTGQV